MTFPADRPCVCLITSGESTSVNFSLTSVKILDLIAMAVNRVSLIQIREKQLDGKLLFDLVSKAVLLTAGSTTKLLVNGRTDVAIAAGADGVHLPSDAYSPEVARGMAGAGFLIGVSTHSVGEIAAAETAGADYVVFGPIFDTSRKSGQGLDTLKLAVTEFPQIPILGLGGIDETNLSGVLETGAAGFAAIRYMNEKENLQQIAKILRSGGNE
jgi:thiamine-phosphate pyrophosphorylase